jgi:hypothetical protein
MKTGRLNSQRKRHNSDKKLKLPRLRLRDCNRIKLTSSNKCKLSPKRNNLKSNNFRHNFSKLRVKEVHKLVMCNNYRRNFRLNKHKWKLKNRKCRCNFNKLSSKPLY